MTRRGFLQSLLAFPFVRALARFLPGPAPVAVSNVRRAAFIGSRAAGLKFAEPFERLSSLTTPLVELAPAYGDPFARTVRVSTEDGEIIWEDVG